MTYLILFDFFKLFWGIDLWLFLSITIDHSVSLFSFVNNCYQKGPTV